ncbi:MAG: AraC family transcriptional regulator [Clostridiales bacterium]|nr:AraC family transcriptional regulator [Clostridiales bacterium]
MKNVLYENTRDKDSALYISVSKSKHCNIHFHRNFEILYVTRGEMEGEVNGVPFNAQEDDIVFVSNYYTHYHNCTQEPHEHCCVIVPAGMSADFIGKFKNKTFPCLLNDKEFNRKIKDILLIPEFNSMPELVKKGYMMVVFGMLLDHYDTVEVETSPDTELIIQILNYIEDNYQKDLTLDTLAKQFGYNKYYFSKLFSRYVKENLTTYINIIRLQHLMKQAVKQSKPNIASLAFDNGFDSLATFYRYFSKMYGCSPSEYLSSIKKD